MDRRSEILQAIREYKGRNDGNSPSEAEIAEQLGISRQAVNKYLQKMESEGMIRRPGKGRRTVQVLPQQFDLPVISAVHAKP
ncbi:MAG TPA: winged helix-turn-helix transcriptional regulator [Candidatus Angelobacter sp.]|nr:winged helix-turn-helix transcriptional regulator [Candidatus Angelobacter sp.]